LPVTVPAARMPASAGFRWRGARGASPGQAGGDFDFVFAIACPFDEIAQAGDLARRPTSRLPIT